MACLDESDQQARQTGAGTNSLKQARWYLSPDYCQHWRPRAEMQARKFRGDKGWWRELCPGLKTGLCYI